MEIVNGRTGQDVGIHELGQAGEERGWIRRQVPAILREILGNGVNFGDPGVSVVRLRTHNLAGRL